MGGEDGKDLTWNRTKKGDLVGERHGRGSWWGIWGRGRGESLEILRDLSGRRQRRNLHRWGEAKRDGAEGKEGGKSGEISWDGEEP